MAAAQLQRAKELETNALTIERTSDVECLRKKLNSLLSEVPEQRAGAFESRRWYYENGCPRFQYPFPNVPCIPLRGV